MLTIFSVPKPFRAYRNDSANAIHSWTLLAPRPEIILLGDDEGAARLRGTSTSHTYQKSLAANWNAVAQ